MAVAAVRDAGKLGSKYKRVPLDLGARRAGRPFGGFDIAAKVEPQEAIRRQRQQIGQLADPREGRSARQFDRGTALESVQVELDRLRGAA